MRCVVGSSLAAGGGEAQRDVRERRAERGDADSEADPKEQARARSAVCGVESGEIHGVFTFETTRPAPGCCGSARDSATAQSRARQHDVVEKLLGGAIRVAVAVHAEVEPERSSGVGVEIPPAQHPSGFIVHRLIEVDDDVTAIVEQIAFLIRKRRAGFVRELIEPRRQQTARRNRNALADAGVAARFARAAQRARIFVVRAGIRMLLVVINAADVAALIPTAGRPCPVSKPEFVIALLERSRRRRSC